MDVRCDRCSTDYEFDATLVSDRGTTVECTTCGHRFKVYPPEGARPEPERWVVRTDDGREFAFFSLRELQTAILRRQLTPDDRLARGSLPPRPLATIAELLPFFEEAQGADTGLPAPRPRMITPAGLGVPSFSPIAPLPRLAGATADITSPDSEDLAPTTSRSPASISDAPRSGEMLPPPHPDRTTSTPVFEPHLEPSLTARALPEAATSDASWPPPAPPRANRRDGGLLLLGLVTVAVTGFLARPYLVPFVTGLWSPTAAEVPDTEERFRSYVAAGEHAMKDGDGEAAKEAYDKANALREQDLGVRIALARLAALRADVIWLRRRLTPEDAQATNTVEEQQAMERVKLAVTRAAEASSNHPAVNLANVDALRLTGDLAAARRHAAALPRDPADAETDYVLAALQIAEGAPFNESLLRQLRRAAAAETVAGRARCLLVYALVRSGDQPSARAELATMSMTPRPPLLVPALRRFAGLEGSSAGAPSSRVPAAALSNEGARPPSLEERKRRPRPPGEFSEDELQNRLETGATPLPSLRPLPAPPP